MHLKRREDIYYCICRRYYKYRRRLSLILQGKLPAAGHIKNENWLQKKLLKIGRQLLNCNKKLAGACGLSCYLLTSSYTARAQVSFAQQTGAANPFNGVDIGTASSPAFVDLDHDGDCDMIAGKGNGTFVYYLNTGTKTAPVYTAQAGAANPLNGVDVGDYSMPAFVDIDHDGDYDVFAGEYDGIFNYYENTGNGTAPAYTLRTGSSNPLNGVDVGDDSAPVFVDIDNDGDWDMFAGEYAGNINYFENTGTDVSAAFTQRTGAANPMNGVDIGMYATPSFIDMDGDGDYDMVVGEFDGVFNYYENTGTVSAPVFTSRTGAANPLNGFNPDFFTASAVVDINGDGDVDILAGIDGGGFVYYKGTNTGIAPLPINLKSFSTTCTGTRVLIQWITSAELNNDFFTVERSSDGILFMPIATINGAGNSNTDIHYSYTDENNVGKQVLYYRLKQTDFDGKYEYSAINAVQCKADGLFFSVYPNPCNQWLNFKISAGQEDDLVLSVSNMAGQKIHEQNIHIIEGITISGIDLHDFASGIYFIQLKNNKYCWHNKFQKQ